MCLVLTPNWVQVSIVWWWWRVNPPSSLFHKFCATTDFHCQQNNWEHVTTTMCYSWPFTDFWLSFVSSDDKKVEKGCFFFFLFVDFRLQSSLKVVILEQEPVCWVLVFQSGAIWDGDTSVPAPLRSRGSLFPLRWGWKFGSSTRPWQSG